MDNQNFPELDTQKMTDIKFIELFNSVNENI